MNILICDDNVDILIQEEFVLETVFDKIEKKVEIRTTTSAKGCLRMVCEDVNFFDLVFLDIEMPELSGIDLGRRIKEKNPLIHIIFVTSYEDYSLQAYKVHPFHYIVKPLQEEQVKEVLSDLQMYEENNTGKDAHTTIQIESNQDIYNISAEDIMYIEKHKNSCKIVAKRKEYRVYKPLKKLEEQLVTLELIQFYRCHQSFVVNMKYIKECSGEDFKLDDDTCIPISRRYKKDAKRRFYQFLREG